MTDNPQTKAFAESVAARLNDRLVKFIDPVSILFIISSLVSIFVNCWRFSNPTGDADPHAMLCEQYAANKPAMIRRAAKRIRRFHHREYGKHLDEALSIELAETMLDEATQPQHSAAFKTCYEQTPAMAITEDDQNLDG